MIVFFDLSNSYVLIKYVNTIIITDYEDIISLLLVRYLNYYPIVIYPLIVAIPTSLNIVSNNH